MVKTNSKLSRAFHEVYENVPKNVKKTGKTGEAKNKMLQAIAFSKARSMKEGGVVKETGLHLLHKNEVVIPAGKSEKSNMTETKLTRAAQVLPDTTFKEGSEGSRIANSNCVPSESKVQKSDVMCGDRGNETRENHQGSRTRDIPKVTNHPFQSEAVIANQIKNTQPEMVRRQNALSRDKRTGNRITENRVYPDNG